MTKKEFKESVDDIISRCVLKAMKAYAASQAIDDQIEHEPVDDANSVFVDDDYNDDLRDRYNEVKFWK